MLGSVGITELLIILAIVVLIFGVNKLPKLGKGLGEGIKNFKDSVRSGNNQNGENNNNDPVEPK